MCSVVFYDFEDDDPLFDLRYATAILRAFETLESEARRGRKKIENVAAP